MRRQQLSQRPDNFVLNNNNSLSTGLVWAGLGNSPTSVRFVDSSPMVANGSLVNCTPSQHWQYNGYLNRFCVSLLAASSRYINGPTYTITPTIFAFSVWSYRTATNTYSSPFNSENIDTDRNGFAVYMATNRIVIETCSASAFTYYLTESSSSTLNTWEHLAGTFNNGYFYIYKNGKLLPQIGGATQGTFISPVLGLYPFKCGADGPNGVDHYHNGFIADPMLWLGRSLTHNEIYELANPANVMLSGLIQPPKRKLYPVYTQQASLPKRFLRLSTNNGRSLFLWK